MVVLHGIKNCDTMKKAIKWLAANDVSYTLHDFKKQGITLETVNAWIESVGWEVLINRRGTTWRKLDDKVKNSIDERSAITVILTNPSIIKRPVLSVNSDIHIGFTENRYQEIFNHV